MGAYYNYDASGERNLKLTGGTVDVADEPVFFYHSDHLGSASYITDNHGNETQHLVYLPFGELRSNHEYLNVKYNNYNEQHWVDLKYNTSQFETPFKFNGKEKDEETGYNYYGARYLNTDLSIWLSVDPMSDKYPHLTSYNYCANNPVMLIDPDGRDLDVANNEQSRNDVKSIANKGNRDRVIINEKGNVSVNTKGLSKEQLEQDKGLSLINNMVKSDKKMLYEASEVGLLNNSDGNRDAVPMFMDNNGVINASNGGSDANGEYTYRPADGYDGHVIVSMSGQFTDLNGNGDMRSSTVFHELAENYFRTDKGYNYNGSRKNNDGFGAHSRAAKWEGNRLGNQSPGSGQFIPSKNLNKEALHSIMDLYMSKKIN